MTESRTGLVDTLRMLVDVYPHDGVTTQIVGELACVRITLTVEVYLLVITDGERGIFVVQFANCQVQTIEVILSVRLLLAVGVVTRLAGGDAVPTKRNLIRADNSRCINRIDFVHRQFQYSYAVATEAVDAVVEIGAGGVVDLVVPCEVITRVHVVNQDVRIRVYYIE